MSISGRARLLVRSGSAPQVFDPSQSLYSKPGTFSQCLVQCWSTVCDAGPTLQQNWVHFSYLNMKHSSKVDSILVHRLRRWPNIEPALCERLVLLVSDQSVRYNRGVCGLDGFRSINPQIDLLLQKRKHVWKFSRQHRHLYVSFVCWGMRGLGEI